MSWFKRLGIVVLCAALASCGFHLRGQATYAFSSVYVNVVGAPLFESELKRSLEGAGSAKLAATATAAQVIVDIPAVVDEKDVLSLSPAGSVQEYALVMRVNFRVHDADGLDWLPAGEIAGGDITAPSSGFHSSVGAPSFSFQSPGVPPVEAR